MENVMKLEPIMIEVAQECAVGRIDADEAIDAVESALGRQITPEECTWLLDEIAEAEKNCELDY